MRNLPVPPPVFGAGGGLGIHQVMLAKWANARVIGIDTKINKKDISIDVHDGVLSIKGNGGADIQDDNVQYIYKGIAKRSFEQKFRLEQYVDVKDAKLSNGLLTISLLREVPEERKPRQITLKSA